MPSKLPLRTKPAGPEADNAPPHLRRDAEENRQRVLNAATEVFAEHGLEAPVEEIASAAGVGMGTLYRRFPNKEALIQQLVRDVFTHLTDGARDALELTDGSGLEMFLWHCGALQERSRGCLSRIWKSESQASYAVELDAILGQLLQRAQGAGRIRPDCTTTDLSVIVWAMRGIIETGGESARHAWERHLEIALAGLRPDAAALTRPPITREQRTRAGVRPRSDS
jgi:AcrR family transcriptional regulator